MKYRKIVQTEDGSSTLYIPELNEHYHSVHGAVQESKHIFIQAGIEHVNCSEIAILEAGFGTGLNAYLSLQNAEENQRHILYHSFEKYPLLPEEVELLQYENTEDDRSFPLFYRLHEAPWEEETAITPFFTLYKHQADFSEACFDATFDLVFFDAFAPDVQPHLWEEKVLEKFCRALKPGGIFVTYCVKGIVKQKLRHLGLTLERLPGPPGKREILRGKKEKD